MNVGIPRAAQPQGLVECRVGCADLQPCRVDPAQRPGEVPVRRIRVGHAHHRRRCAGAPVGTRVGEEVARTRELQAKRRRGHCCRSRVQWVTPVGACGGGSWSMSGEGSSMGGRVASRASSGPLRIGAKSNRLAYLRRMASLPSSSNSRGTRIAWFRPLRNRHACLSVRGIRVACGGTPMLKQMPDAWSCQICTGMSPGPGVSDS